MTGLLTLKNTSYGRGNGFVHQAHQSTIEFCPFPSYSHTKKESGFIIYRVSLIAKGREDVIYYVVKLKGSVLSCHSEYGKVPHTYMQALNIATEWLLHWLL